MSDKQVVEIVGTGLVLNLARSITQNILLMKTHTYLLTLTLVAFSFGLKANTGEINEKEDAGAKTEILDIVDTENLAIEECVACPVPVQVFDKDFNLIMSGEMTPMQEVSSQQLAVVIGQSNLIMDSGTAMIYQLEE